MHSLLNRWEYSFITSSFFSMKRSFNNKLLEPFKECRKRPIQNTFKVKGQGRSYLKGNDVWQLVEDGTWTVVLRVKVTHVKKKKKTFIRNQIVCIIHFRETEQPDASFRLRFSHLLLKITWFWSLQNKEGRRKKKKETTTKSKEN